MSKRNNLDCVCVVWCDMVLYAFGTVAAAAVAPIATAMSPTNTIARRVCLGFVERKCCRLSC